MNTWNGSTPLVHFLMDDDIIYPEFYERHIALHAANDIDCSISRRWTGIESGQPLGLLPRPAEVQNRMERVLALNADFVFASTIPPCNNWFGELSNCVLNVAAAKLLDKSSLADISFEGLGDIGLFISASIAKPLGYINDSLSVFRLNPQQNSQSNGSADLKRAHVAWTALALAGRRLGKLTQAQASQSMNTIYRTVSHRYAGSPDMQQYFDAVPGLLVEDPAAERDFLQWWHAYVTMQ
jgi:hypothetical protein